MVENKNGSSNFDWSENIDRSDKIYQSENSQKDAPGFPGVPQADMDRLHNFAEERRAELAKERAKEQVE